MNTFVQITETISAVFKGNSKKKKVLFVVNTDNGYGLYVKKLVRFAKSLGLEPKSKAALKNIKFGQVIAFGESNDFDYRVIKDVVGDVENGRFEGIEAEAFDLTQELDEVLEAIEDLFPKRHARRQKESKTNTAFLYLGSTLGEQPRRNRFCGPSPQFVVMEEPVDIYNEDVAIHDTFVKIGYKSYDIWVERTTGREYIRLGDRKRYIMVDRFGDKYLK